MVNSNSEPLISVIVPIYKVEKYIEKCLASLVSQTFQDFEIICVDDASPDLSGELARKFETEFPHFRIIRHERNLGLGGARNTGIVAAQGEYIVGVDSDDAVAPEFLEHLVAPILKAEKQGDQTKPDCVIIGFCIVDETGKKLSTHRSTKAAIETIANYNNEIDLFDFTNPSFWNKLWRKSLFTENDIWFPNHTYFEDLATTPRLLTKCNIITKVPATDYFYLMRDQSIMNSISDKHILDHIRVFCTLSDYLQDQGLFERYADDLYEMINGSYGYQAHLVNQSTRDLAQKEAYLDLMLITKYGLTASLPTLSSADKIDALSGSLVPAILADQYEAVVRTRVQAAVSRLEQQLAERTQDLNAIAKDKWWFWSWAKRLFSRRENELVSGKRKLFLDHLTELLKAEKYDVLISELDDPKNKRYSIPSPLKIRAYRRAGLRKEAVELGEKIYNSGASKDSELATEYLWSLVSVGETQKALPIALDFAKETEIKNQSMAFIHVLLRVLYSNGNMKDILTRTSEYIKSGKTSPVLHAYRAGAAFEENDQDVYVGSIKCFKLEKIPKAHFALKKNLFLYRVTELLKAEKFLELIGELDDPRNEKYSIPATLRIRAYRRASMRKEAVELSEKIYNSNKKKSSALVTEYLWSLVSVGEIQKALSIALSFFEGSKIESQNMGFIHVFLRVLYSNGNMKDILRHTSEYQKSGKTSPVLHAYRAGAAFEENDLDVYASSIGCFKLEDLPPAHFALKRNLFDNFESNFPAVEKRPGRVLRSSLRFSGLNDEEDIASNVHLTEQINRDNSSGNEDTDLHENEAFRSRYIFDLLSLAETREEYLTDIDKEIPKTIIQFWHETDNIPEDIKKCLESWGRLEARGYARLLFNDSQARTFIEQELGSNYLQAFERCHHPAMRCDYFRLCYLLLNGGFYVDADELFRGGDCDQLFSDSKIKLQPLCYDSINHINIPCQFVKEKSYDASRIYYFANSPIICPKGHPIVSLALERATRKLLETSNKLEIQSTTGPINLSACVVKYAMNCRFSQTKLDLRVIEDWDEISASMPLSYRADERNWRNANTAP